MVKTRRQKKMRGGGKGTLEITWRMLENDEEKRVNLNKRVYNLEERGYDTGAMVESVKTKVEAHVVQAGYKKTDYLPYVDKTLDVVDVEFDAANAPAVSPIDITETVKNDAGATKTIVLKGAFKFRASGGRKTRGKKTAGRRHSRR
jgi:hypothetical protein